MTITDHLDEIEARANAATEGPWTTRKQRESAEDPNSQWIYPGNIVVEPNGQIVVTQTGNGANSEFIAHARADVPALVAAVRAVLDACDRIDASIIPNGDFETGQKSVTGAIRAVATSALGEATP